MPFDLKLDANSRGRDFLFWFIFSGQYDQFLRDRQKLVERVDGIVRFQDLLLAVELEVKPFNLLSLNKSSHLRQ